MVYVVKPIILLPADGIDVVGRNDLVGLAKLVLRPVEEWWEGQGQIIHLLDVTIDTAPLDLSDAYPWDDLWIRLRDKQEVPSKEEQVLYFLAGWDDRKWAGWGGNGLAVVGDEFYKFARLGGDYVDAAAGLVAHEIGHTLRGTGHLANNQSPPDIMSIDSWKGMSKCISREYESVPVQDRLASIPILRVSCEKGG